MAIGQEESFVECQIKRQSQRTRKLKGIQDHVDSGINTNAISFVVAGS